MSPASVDIILADDHEIFLEGVVRLIAGQPRLHVVKTCLDGFDAECALQSTSADVAVLDISMPGPGASHLIEVARSIAPPVPVILLTMHKDLELVETLLGFGAQAYVLKDDAFDELSCAIDSVVSGETYICKSILAQAERNTESKTGLTKRELECLKLASRGVLTKNIAFELNLTERTVNFHISNICRKLGVSRRSEAVAVAFETQIIRL